MSSSQMTVEDGEMSRIFPVDGAAAPSRAGGEGDGAWEDVTPLFAAAASEMHVGEMVHLPDFSLYAAMSAIELMEPKMDVGCGPVRNVSDVQLPASLSDADVVRIMDELLACQATWMEAHTLAQTVFACAYTQRIEEVPRPELAAFIRIQLASMSLVRALVTAEQVSDEEDFISYNFGFTLPTLSGPTVAKLVKDATDALTAGGASGAAGASREASVRRLLCARLKFIQLFHSTLTALAAPKCKRLSQAEVFIELAAAQLKLIDESWAQFPDDVIALTFDSTFNRHLLANTPPRTAPVLAREAALAVWATLLDQMRVLTILKHRVLPASRRLRRHPADSPCTSPAAAPATRPGEENGDGAGGELFFSLHSLLHGLSEFSAMRNPSVVTRSLLKRMLLPTLREPAAVFSTEEAPLAGLVLGDIGLGPDGASATLRRQAEDLVPAAGHIVWSLLRNRGRQRRCLVQSLVAWDQAVARSAREPADPPPHPDDAPADARVAQAASRSSHAAEEEQEERGGAASARGDSGKPRDMFAGKTPLQLFAHEVSVRIMMQHWLLGFECNLYSPKEYAPVFFYVGYVVTTAVNATAALANAGLADAELHPCRYALYLLDEARLWLCRALFSMLEALELGPNWAYGWRRRRRRWVPARQAGDPPTLLRGGETMRNGVETTADDRDDDAAFESEAEWYDQRFGMMSRLSTGPQFMDYRTFLTLTQLQRNALMEKGPAGCDEIDVRLGDATDGFKMVREALNRARAAAQICGWEPILDETVALTRVAVSNLVVLAQLKREKLATDQAAAVHGTNPAEVQFCFKAHRHFPVVTVSTA
jgi:hypothetical protein